MRDHSFSPEVATKYGVDEAIFINALAYWIRKNRANHVNFRVGRWWTFLTLSAMCDLFPYWNKGKLERIVANCKAKGVIHTGDFNDNRQRRTIWYALDDSVLLLLGEPTCCSVPELVVEGDESISHFSEMPQAIPDSEKCIQINKEVNKKKITPIPPEGGERFEVFWKAYPKRIKRLDAEKAWQKLKVDDALLATILAALEVQKRSPQWNKADKQYIPYPATWLNGHCWEDEVPTGPGGGGRPLTASEKEMMSEWS